MVTGLATDAQEQCPCSPTGGTDWDPWRAEKGGRRAARGQEGSTKTHADIQLVKRYHQRAPPPPSPDQPGLMLWRASPTAKVPAIAEGPACTPVPRQGKSTAKRMGEERGGHRQREDLKGRSVFLHHSKFFLVGYEQDELWVAGVIASRSNQGAQALPLVCQSLGEDTFRTHQLQQIYKDGCGARTYPCPTWAAWLQETSASSSTPSHASETRRRGAYTRCQAMSWLRAQEQRFL